MRSLYQICVTFLAQNTDCITDLSSVPFDPYIQDLLTECYTRSQKRLSYNILRVIGRSHAKKLSELQYGSLMLSSKDSHTTHEKILRSISTSFPWSIYRLNLSFSNLGDNDLWLLNSCIYLAVLDLTCTQISDHGVAHISRMGSQISAAGNDRGLQCLQVLSLAGNRYVTDRSLKHLARLDQLRGLDLSSTNVTEVARTFLTRQGYETLCSSNDKINTNDWPHHKSSLISWQDGYTPSPSTVKYLVGSTNPAYRSSCMIATSSSELLPISASGPRPTPYLPIDYKKSIVGLTQLCFLRKETRGVKRASKSPGTRKLKEIKTQSTDDYIAMVRKEFGL